MYTAEFELKPIMYLLILKIIKFHFKPIHSSTNLFVNKIMYGIIKDTLLHLFSYITLSLLSEICFDFFFYKTNMTIVIFHRDTIISRILIL